VNEVGGGGATAEIHDGKHAVNFNFSPLYHITHFSLHLLVSFFHIISPVLSLDLAVFVLRTRHEEAQVCGECRAM
jgi:hypothetical protein